MEIINSFPGYEFKFIEGDNEPHNMYRGVDVGKGGYIVSNPGIYGNVALLDIASLHPNSIRAMNCFGEYTKNFTDIVDARVAIKHGDFETARTMLNGRLAPYLEDESNAADLSQALKISINSVYGLTAANFDNPFRDIRNKNNIVALRGALFMKTLQDEVESRGFQIVAIKTDSIKIADATLDIVLFCMDFAKRYGYTFEHEATYERICQVNDADYVAKYATLDQCYELYDHEYVGSSKDILKECKKHSGEWTVTGAKFAVPYVFKKLFTKESIEFKDLCETKEVKSAMYLDMNESLPEGDHEYRFVGKVGSFCPVRPGRGGGELLRQATDKEGNVKYDSVAGTKGYRWLEAEVVEASGSEGDIDLSYYDNLVNEAIYGSGTKGTKAYRPGISDFGDFEWFVSDDPYVLPVPGMDDEPPFDIDEENIVYPFTVR